MLIREGREAYRRGDADAARRAYEQAAEESAGGEALEGLAKAIHLAGDYAEAMTTYERAYAAYRREAKLLDAARAARTLGWFRGSLVGDWAVYRGWVERARSLLLQASEGGNEHGWVLLAEARAGSDLEAQKRSYLAVIATARRYGDCDLECEALVCLGIMLVCSGFTDEGLVYMDAALAGVCAGDVEDLSVVEGVFCGLFHICDRTNDIVRAEQWLRAADDFVRSRKLGAVAGYCRAHYGGILIAAGRWAEAEQELLRAAQILSSSDFYLRGTAFCRLAELRMRQGRIEDAAELLAGLEYHEDAVRPLVGLHLARGETALARDLLERTLDGHHEDAVEGPLLALLVDVHIASGALEVATDVGDRLSDLARNQSSDFIKAVAALTRGKLCVATGGGDARACFHQALLLFARAQAPVDLARTRLELARALAWVSPDVAIAEATAALASFEELSARRDADETAALLRSLGGPARTGPKGRTALTKRETEVLELLGHGLTNVDIGARLFISPKTVEHHVGRILSKLGLRSRSHAAAFATRAAEPRPAEQ